MTDRVFALWFDKDGCGPDHFQIEVTKIDEDRDGEELVADEHLGLRVRRGRLVINGAKMVDGGFMLDYDHAVILHRQIGEWLAKFEAKP